jgi:hypothetical protein
MDSLAEVNNSQISYQEQEKNDKEEIRTEKYIYHFDYPLLNESGYIDIYPNKIVILFPAKSNKSTSNGINISQNVSVYLNQQLRFSYHWLPIYTLYDLYKIKDMLIKTSYEYKTLTNVHISKKNNYIPFYCNEILTEWTNSSYEISCFENCNTTTFDITINKEKNETDTKIEKFINLQVFIGSNLIFCGERDLLNNNLPVKDGHFIINMMLDKLTK